jgi:glycosyltransferase involved in cell wall biosynthesis
MFGWEFPPFNSGGLGVACLGLTRALSELGMEVLFVMPKKLDLSIPWAKVIFADAGVEGRVINSTLKAYATGRSYGKSSGDGMYGNDLLAEVYRYGSMGGAIARAEHFDVIYAHDWLSFPAGMEAKKATGKPLIVHVHATEFDRCGGAMGINREVFEIEKAGMEAADCVIAVSDYTRQIIIREYGIPAWKVRVVYNGIDETTAPSGNADISRLRALRAAGWGVVLFLGRITLQKGPDHFLRAAQRALEKNPKILFILSGDGDMREQIMNLAGSLGIADKVSFTGFVGGEDRAEAYRAADLFVMPSVSEPFGITALEAMRLGTPVLISKQSGVSEVVKHALKVDFWDVEAMANKILSVVGYRGLAKTLSENAQLEAEGLTWTEAAHKVDGIVKELTGAGVQ